MSLHVDTLLCLKNELRFLSSIDVDILCLHEIPYEYALDIEDTFIQNNYNVMISNPYAGKNVNNPCYMIASKNRLGEIKTTESHSDNHNNYIEMEHERDMKLGMYRIPIACDSKDVHMIKTKSPHILCMSGNSVNFIDACKPLVDVAAMVDTRNHDVLCKVCTIWIDPSFYDVKTVEKIKLSKHIQGVECCLMKNIFPTQMPSQ